MMFTSFLGRDAEVAAASRLLLQPQVRLLTLTGPGGVGKTRLALRIAEEVAGSLSDGVIFVPLAAITDPNLVLSAIARALGLRETGGQAVADLLVNHLCHRQLLLVLDNVEQVTQAAPLVAALVGDCRELSVLATSRARLNISSEHRFPVPPLALPDDSPYANGAPLAAVVASPAVQLFVERAQTVEPRFTLNDGNAQAVAAICRRLDGLPLAIELAAVRTQLLSPAELLERLEPALRLLTDGPTDAPDRLRTMRNAIVWSYDLLDPAAQTTLRRLSVFVGGFTLAAAEAVVADPAAIPLFLDTMATLVDASLVRRHSEGQQTRFTMLETIREFSLEHLASSGEMAAISSRHAAWAVQLAEGGRRSGALSRREGLDQLESEHPNFRAALSWLVASRRGEAAQHLAGELAEFWLRRGHFLEGMAWIERVLAIDDGRPTAARANALVGQSLVLWAQAAHTNVHSEADPPGDEPDDFAQTVRLLDEAEAVARAAGDAGALAYARLHQGYVAYFRGDLDLAEARGIEAMVTAAAIPQGFNRNGPDWLLAEVALARGDDGRAQEYFSRLLALARAGGDETSQANALAGLAQLAERRGDPAAALHGFAEAVSICHSFGDRLHAVLRLEQAAATTAAFGLAAGAVRLLAAADALRVAEGLGAVRLEMRLRRRHEQALRTARAALGERLFATHWVAGAALSLDAGIAEIHVLAGQVRVAAPADHEAASTAVGTWTAIEVALPAPRSMQAIDDDRRRLAASDRPPSMALTPREREVLHLLADGLGDKAIALTLGVARRTASKHVAAILSKLGVESRTAAVSNALRRGLLGS